MAEKLSVAAWIAEAMLGSNINTIFGLQGGHIQPIWDEFTRRGGRVIDARDERAAVHMAHAYGEVSGEVGIALVTAGPGVTNAVTAMANAMKSRSAVLLFGGAAPIPQKGLGALQEIPQVELMKPVTRMSLTISEPELLAQALRLATVKLRGLDGVAGPGPVFLEVPTDVLRTETPWREGSLAVFESDEVQGQEPSEREVSGAVNMFWKAKKPLVIAGRGARQSGEKLLNLLDASGAAYLDTQECRGLVSERHSSFVGAVRGKAMAEADLVVTLGRKLDFQLGYGSRAIFPQAQFLRIAENDEERCDNLRGDEELKCSVGRACELLLEGASSPLEFKKPSWAEGLRKSHVDRSHSLTNKMLAREMGADGFMHPYSLLAIVRKFVNEDTIFVADGGDILSFARICIQSRYYMDSGAFGCLGVGLPFAIGASLGDPRKTVLAVIGDGSFGFNAMELDTALRYGANVVFIVANNGGWNIERTDQIMNFEGRIQGSELSFTNYGSLASAIGLYAQRVERIDDLEVAISQGMENSPALVDVVVTRDAISPDARSGLPGVPDLQALGSWDEAQRKLNENEQ